MEYDIIEDENKERLLISLTSYNSILINTGLDKYNYIDEFLMTCTEHNIYVEKRSNDLYFSINDILNTSLDIDVKEKLENIIKSEKWKHF